MCVCVCGVYYCYCCSSFAQFCASLLEKDPSALSVSLYVECPMGTTLSRNRPLLSTYVSCTRVRLFIITDKHNRRFLYFLFFRLVSFSSWFVFRSYTLLIFTRSCSSKRIMILLARRNARRGLPKETNGGDILFLFAIDQLCFVLFCFLLLCWCDHRHSLSLFDLPMRVIFLGSFLFRSIH